MSAHKVTMKTKHRRSNPPYKKSLTLCQKNLLCYIIRRWFRDFWLKSEKKPKTHMGLAEFAVSTQYLKKIIGISNQPIRTKTFFKKNMFRTWKVWRSQKLHLTGPLRMRSGNAYEKFADRRIVFRGKRHIVNVRSGDTSARIQLSTISFPIGLKVTIQNAFTWFIYHWTYCSTTPNGFLPKIITNRLCRGASIDQWYHFVYLKCVERKIWSEESNTQWTKNVVVRSLRVLQTIDFKLNSLSELFLINLLCIRLNEEARKTFQLQLKPAVYAQWSEMLTFLKTQYHSLNTNKLTTLI
jgi:hypothetical protein